MTFLMGVASEQLACGGSGIAPASTASSPGEIFATRLFYERDRR
jgi:hypothetical protein